MLNLKQNWLQFLLASSLIVSLAACSTASGNFEENPKIKIPNLPKSVKYTEPKLPNKPAKDAKGTAEILQEYERTNESNRFAIEQAKKHNKELQRIYNSK